MPVLTYLDQIDGVESSFANESATLIRLSLRPGANPGKVTGAVRRILSERTEDLVPVQLDGGAAAAALQREEWRDKSQVTELAATEMDLSGHRTPRLLMMLVVALFLGWTAIGLGLLWWRHRSRRRREENVEWHGLLRDVSGR